MKSLTTRRIKNDARRTKENSADSTEHYDVHDVVASVQKSNGTMKELIDKAAVVAEIERLREEEYPCDTFEESTGYYNALDEIDTFLNTLEVKETDDAYKQGYNDAIDKACDAYCRLCDTKECGDTGECEWVEKFRKRLMR